MSKALTTFAGIKRGTRFKVINNSNGHNYPQHKVLIFKKDGLAGVSQMSDIAEGMSCNTIELRDIRLCNESLTDLHQKVVELQEELDLANEKIKVCNDLGLTEYDDNVIKVHKALAIIKTKKTDVEMSQAIASLMTSLEE